MRVCSGLILKLTALQAQPEIRPCLIVGCRLGGSTIAVDLINFGSESGSELHKAAREILPHGLVYIGTWATSQSEALKLMERNPILECLEDPAVKDPQVLVACSNPEAGGSPLLLTLPLSLVKQRASSGRSSSSTSPDAPIALEQGPHELATAWMNVDKLHLVRYQAELELCVYEAQCGGSSTSSFQAALDAAFQLLEDELRDPRVVFLIENKAQGKRAVVGGPCSSTPLAGLMTSSADVPIEAKAMRLPSSSSDLQRAPMFRYDPLVPGSGSGGPVVLSSCSLRLDALAYAGEGTAFGAEALLKQLAVVRAVMSRQGRVLQVAAHHFLPPGRAHYLTLLYPEVKPDAAATELALAPFRRELHALLGLPMDRPALRVGSALTWQQAPLTPSTSSAAPTQERLRDVHLGLPMPGPEAGCVHLLQGSYDYHHYMQDRFDDSGWGCAYRSLQTICSWFRIQQYTSRSSPSHKEIQQCLVKLGDKEKSFVGSNKWIGAIELSYILDDYLGVTSKIITINRGSDIPSHARELAAHFRTQGTPIMIGGGVLAYTLLGVYFNESSGDCAFLILDPHYTGGETLGRIHKGTWVGWKRPGDTAAAGGPLFVQDAFYNFLCPQRPKEL